MKRTHDYPTVVESPARRLRRQLGLPEVSARSRPRVDDYFPFRIGDAVVLKDDPAHEGKVRAVVYNQVRITWDSGWLDTTDYDPKTIAKVGWVEPEPEPTKGTNHDPEKRRRRRPPVA